MFKTIDVVNYINYAHGGRTTFECNGVNQRLMTTWDGLCVYCETDGASNAIPLDASISEIATTLKQNFENAGMSIKHDDIYGSLLDMAPAAIHLIRYFTNGGDDITLKYGNVEFKFCLCPIYEVNRLTTYYRNTKDTTPEVERIHVQQMPLSHVAKDMYEYLSRIAPTQTVKPNDIVDDIMNIITEEKEK